MNPTEQKHAAKAFVARWQAAEGNEQRESNKFWIELCQEVLGIPNATHVLDFERKAKGRRIDVFYEDMGILIENKSRGVSLDAPEQRGKDVHGRPRMVTPYEQARWYADNITPRSIAPKWLLTCNFDEMRIYDLDCDDAEESYEIITLEELPAQYHRLSFFRAKENSRLEREKQLSVAAGAVVGRLYDAFAKAYRNIETDAQEQKSLNILITRIVFLLFAEDAELLHERNAFYQYLKSFQVNHMRQALIDLFAVLKTPKEERDPYIDPDLAAFPYVNGGLFEADIVIPQFTADVRFILLQEASAEFDWRDISPTIFGAVFESTLNPLTRRAGGMHYTSVENIHKLTGPLFMDDLRAELAAIEGAATEKERKFKLQAYRRKLASLKFLDPACGSGNFLTETYIGLRKLENRVLEGLYGGQMVMGEFDPIQVTADQFFGIEINDFAVEVAKTALWIAELQMLDETREILSMWIDPLPLKRNDNIVCANALRKNWNEVLPAEECSYIIGNPPFVGYSYLNEDQKDDRLNICGKGSGFLDYVACWYFKAANYMAGYPVRAALVSTNSICQGLQVDLLWKPLFESGIGIDFAWRTFVWNSEATDQAHVHCVIVGFSRMGGPKALFDSDGLRHDSANINGYLLDAPSQFISKRAQPLCDVPPMAQGHKPAEHGCLLLSAEERAELIAREPGAERWIRPFSMGAEFINGIERYCLWLHGITDEELDALPLVKERVDACRAWREAQVKTGDAYRYRTTPHLFKVCNYFHDVSYIGVPSVSSERREYVPMGFVANGMIPGNQLYFVESDSLYMFGVMQSRIHNAWMRVVAGRLESRYRYANTIVYNNFVWPEPTAEQHAAIEAAAQAVLDARANHPGASLATLYDPDKMPLDLREAHAALDAAVEAAYGATFNGDEEKIVAHLFNLYAEKTR